jgi:hypothetical protein
MYVGGRRLYAHRLALELWLGRPLDAEECVHHRDGNKTHNCPPNLELTTMDAHSWQHRRTLPLVGYCLECGQPFLQRRSHRKPQRFCCPNCWLHFGFGRTRGRFKAVEWLVAKEWASPRCAASLVLEESSRPDAVTRFRRMTECFG